MKNLGVPINDLIKIMPVRWRWTPVFGQPERKLSSKPTVKLIGQDGNAFSVLGRVKQTLKSAGADQEYTDKYINEATSVDYYHLLVVSMKYVDVQ